MLIDNSFTVQGELILDNPPDNRPYCYIENQDDLIGNDGIGDTTVDANLDGIPDLFTNCRSNRAVSIPEATDTIGNFFDLSPKIYSYSFTTDNVTVDLVTNESAASTLSAADATSDAILAIQTFGSPTTFDESTRSLDIGVKISEAVVVGSGGADTSPFSIRFSVE